MTNAYDTIKLRNLPQITQAAGSTVDVTDQNYEFEARANDDADGDGQIDFFKSKIGSATWSEENLSALQKGASDKSGQTPFFLTSRYFADDAGALWTASYTLVENAGTTTEHLVHYERFDGTGPDTNQFDGNYFIAAKDIGRAFKNKAGNEEFTNFIDSIAKQYGPLFDTVTAALSGSKLPGATIDAEAFAALLADPSLSIKESFEKVYASSAVSEHLANIEKLILFHQYLTQGQVLAAGDATVYKMPAGATPRSLTSLFPNASGTAKPSAPSVPPATIPSPSAVPPTVTAMVAPATTAAVSTTEATSAFYTHIYDVARTTGAASADDLAMLQNDIAEINKRHPGTLPAGLEFNHALINTGGREKNWPDMIVDGSGAFEFVSLNDNGEITGFSPKSSTPQSQYKNYRFTKEGVRELHIDLWEFAKKKSPEKFFFGTVGIKVNVASLKEDSGYVHLEGGEFSAADKVALDRVASMLASASVSELAGVTVTGYATASGEKIKGPGNKELLIVEDSYSGSMTGKVKISTCIGADNKPKTADGYSWITGKTPPTGANDTGSAKKKIDKVVAYLRSKGVKDEILNSESLFKTVRAGGHLKPGVRVEFTRKESAQFKLYPTDFPELSDTSTASFLASALNPYFATASALVKSSDSEANKKTKLLRAATGVEIALHNTGLTDADALKFQGLLFDKIAANRSAPGAEALLQILNISFFGGKRMAPAQSATATTTVATAIPATLGSATVAMKDLHVFSNPTTFKISGDAPTIQLSKGGADNIAENGITYNGRTVAFHTVSCNETSCTIVLDGMNSEAKKSRQRKLDDAANEFASDADKAKYGLGNYSLVVKFEDGSTTKIQVRATGL